MKITFVLPGVSRFPIGGYKVVYQYANKFAELGHMVEIVHVENISTRKTNLRAILKNIALSTNILNKKNIKWFDFNKNINVKCVNSFRNSNFQDADAIIATAWQTAVPVFKLPASKGIKYYFIQHYEIQHGHKDEVDYTWRLPITKIVIATWLKNLGYSLGVECKLVKNFVDKDEYYITNPMEKREPSISMLYHDEEWKGSKDGIEALNYILNDFPEINIKMFGIPERPKSLDSRITYFKNCSVNELRDEIYNKTSIFLFPSHKEGWGLTATEAMLCGNALVSTKNGGVLDFGIEGKTALLTNVGDIRGLVDNIELLIRDKELRMKLQLSGVMYVSELSIENSSKKFLSIINKGKKND